MSDSANIRFGIRTPTSTASVDHRTPASGMAVFSVLAPFVGLLCGFLVFAVIASRGPHAWIAGMDPGIYTLFGFIGLGLLSAIIATARRERLWGLTALGLVLNGIPSFCMLYNFALGGPYYILRHWFAGF